MTGYRYELFCATKAARSNQCTLFCGIQKERAWEFNQQRNGEETLDLAKVDDVSKLDNSNISYSREIFDGLCMRFEEPHGNSRWDSPLFVAFPDDVLEFDAMFSSLFESKPLPPNQSTQNVSKYVYKLQQNSFLYCFDHLFEATIKLHKLLV